MKIYASALADKKLRDKNFATSAKSQTLNFTFAGNPGTGKTTVARIFGQLLEQAGARGGKFIQMTAQEALRKGVAKVAAELAALTNAPSGNGPPPTLRINAQVQTILLRVFPDVFVCLFFLAP